MTDKPIYAQGGYIPAPPPGMQAFQLSRGCVLMSLASYRALGPDMIEKLFADQDVDLVMTADEVRELGAEGVEKLQKELGE